MLWSALVCQAFYSHLFVLLLRPITYRLIIDYPNSNTNRRYATFNTSRKNSKKPRPNWPMPNVDGKTMKRGIVPRKCAVDPNWKATEELNALKRNDPQAIADLEKELELVKGAANRWMDNIFACKDFGDYGCV
eukprot:scaffold105100_cov42-Cyclotella_meneghiniana.AAC.1